MTHPRPSTHDLGGIEPHASAPIDRREHDLTQFDKNVDALMYLLSHPSRRLIRVDELRRAIESLTPENYARFSYYEKWLTAMHDLLIEKDVLSEEEILLKIAELRQKDEGAA
jgi:nitrile hydratase subunit beta